MWFCMFYYKIIFNGMIGKELDFILYNFMKNDQLVGCLYLRKLFWVSLVLMLMIEGIY